MHKINRHNGQHSDAQLDPASGNLLQELRHLVQTERDLAMMSMPTERVMRAIKRASRWASEDVWSVELLSWFRPVLIIGALVIMVLSFYNMRTSRLNDYPQTTTEMVLGLPPITVASAYDPHIEDH